MFRLRLRVGLCLRARGLGLPHLQRRGRRRIRAHQPGPDVAFNSTDDEYLVIWNGDGLSSDQEFEISGQRVGTSGEELGADFRITNAGIDGTMRGVDAKSVSRLQLV